MHACMDGATKTLYALTHGKKPSRADMEQMAEDFGFNAEDKPSPLDFFAQQSGMFPEPEVEFEDEPELKRLRERILQRDSDESLYDYFEVKAIMMGNRFLHTEKTAVN